MVREPQAFAEKLNTGYAIEVPYNGAPSFGNETAFEKVGQAAGGAACASRSMQTDLLVTIRKQHTFHLEEPRGRRDVNTFDGDDIRTGMSVFVVEEKGSRGSIPLLMLPLAILDEGYTTAPGALARSLGHTSCSRVWTQGEL
ncbi:hypothetical protein FA13DRAFT_1705393 [Coprinellus micaceus]|uniref:Uncharacterized protein n=1 Tax=Coprinellus micaceus TaxID=71717 RepID=A0A4Y7TWG4_COPMI|nr:hypothetical protein FA13DRAFT_1705393 [Coprinellus micaceus]